MTKGKPFTRREKRDVWAMRNEKFPSIIARYLVTRYPLDNGGQRTERGVRELLTRMRAAEQEGRLRDELGVDDADISPITVCEEVSAVVVVEPAPVLKVTRKHIRKKSTA
jgi:hypothetical protein